MAKKCLECSALTPSPHALRKIIIQKNTCASNPYDTEERIQNPRVAQSGASQKRTTTKQNAYQIPSQTDKTYPKMNATKEQQDLHIRESAGVDATRAKCDVVVKWEARAGEELLYAISISLEARTRLLRRNHNNNQLSQ